jgi:formiminotetrahydrofolate cyclodeaminase
VTQAVGIEQHTVSELLDAIAARQPVPGGGAVAALTAALAAALGRMVVEYSRGKSSATGHEALHAEVLSALADLQARALTLAEADAEAFGKLSGLWKLKRDDPQRQAQWPGAVAAAIDAPRRVMETSRQALELLNRLSESVGANIRSDLAISALLAQAGAEAAACNVRINLPLLEDADEGRRLEAETVQRLAAAADLRRAIEDACRV